MSRSFKHTPICGHTSAHSDKWNKKKAHRVFRRVTRSKLLSKITNLSDMVDVIIPNSYDEINAGNIWGWAKDGKMWFRDDTDCADYKKLLRK